MSISVLAGMTGKDLQTFPYAHVAKDDVFVADVYKRLSKSFPAPERFIQGLTEVASNQAVRIPAVDIVDSSDFDPLWREFFAYHTSREFWLDVLRVMGDGIRLAHPNIEQMFGKKLEDFTVSRRGSGAHADIQLDALFVINTPVTKESSVRPAHVDAENEIYACLLYMKDDDDPTAGGDLALYHFKNRPMFGGHYAELEDVIEDKVVQYGANRLAGFVNSAASIHGVTPRAVTGHYRRYINIIGKCERNIFSLPKLPLHRQLMFWLDRRKNKAAGTMAKKAAY